MLTHAEAQLEVTPCTRCFGKLPQPHAQDCPSAPRHSHTSNCDHVFFWRVCPRPCRQNQKYYQSAFSLHKSALALALGCTSMPKLSQKLHLYTLSLSLSQVPGLRLFFNTQSQLGAVFLYLLCCNHPSLQSKSTPSIRRANLQIPPVCSEISKAQATENTEPILRST